MVLSCSDDDSVVVNDDVVEVESELESYIKGHWLRTGVAIVGYNPIYIEKCMSHDYFFLANGRLQSKNHCEPFS